MITLRIKYYVFNAQRKLLFIEQIRPFFIETEIIDQVYVYIVLKLFYFIRVQ
jgi:hypothetical protein